MAPLSLVDPNPSQPRQYFDDERLEELAASIRVHGVLQPLLVKKIGSRYQLVAGERRFRAAKIAGLDTVPVIVEDITSQQQLEIALIENLQREDLNAMEEARAYHALVTKYNLSHETIAQQVGKARTTVVNALRLLKLPTAIQRDIEAGRISAGHARAILSLDSTERQNRLHKAILAEDLSVRGAEQLARRLSEPKPPVTKSPQPVDPQIKALEDRLTEALGAISRIKPTTATQGRIEISYLSLDDLDRILLILDVESDNLK
ncbi:MAG: ParB/RepB/Spo0J family partition protein [Candidatus Sumerlaeota bacterium]|nr:ParB/RepB/Spo0J family partition protein [Candidatus Sumerlaeota bacterium]